MRLVNGHIAVAPINTTSGNLRRGAVVFASEEVRRNYGIERGDVVNYFGAVSESDGKFIVHSSSVVAIETKE